MLLVYRVPRHQAAPLVPAGLDLLTRGPWAFWNVVIIRIEGLRAEGLHFTRSDGDHLLVNILGNRLSDFRYHWARVALGGLAEARGPWTVEVSSRDGFGDLALSASLEDGASPQAGTDRDLQYRPLGLCPDATGRIMRLARVVRDEACWREWPLRVHGARLIYLEKLGMADLALVRATRVEPLTYRWDLGERVPIESGPEPRHGMLPWSPP